MHNIGPPTYRQMTEMLQEAEKRVMESGLSLGDTLYEIYKNKFPSARIPSRSARLLEAAERIAAPVKDGSHSCHFDQDKYLDKLWIPKVGNTSKLIRVKLPHFCDTVRATNKH